MINLFYGSIFDTKCDMLIIPCNSHGGVSSSIWDELLRNDLQVPPCHIDAGTIKFNICGGRFYNASYIGFAASVDAETNDSSVEILKKIIASIKVICQELSIQRVNLPLLGSGAGGLTDEISYNTLYDGFNHETNLLINICVISSQRYNKLLSSKRKRERPQIKHPRVFISYTATTQADRNWVKQLATKLRQNGVEARVDIFHLKPGQDLPQWMTNEIIMADKVLMICNEQYSIKSDSRKGGVGWESMIIQGDMLNTQNQLKYIAILREADVDRSLPIYAKSKYALDWSKEENAEKNFEELLLNLFDCDTEPPIGDIPKFVIEKLGSREMGENIL